MQKEKERKNKGNRKYGQAREKHAKKGVTSCICGGLVIIIGFVILFLAYTKRGEIPTVIGGLGISLLALSGVGLSMAIRGFREREKNYITCKIGLGINLGSLISLALIFLRGFF